MKRVVLLLVICSMVLVPGVCQAQVANGGFETGDFTSWTEWGDVSSNFVAPGGGYQSEGTYMAFFGPTAVGGGGIRQTVNLLGTYELSFDYRPASSGGNWIRVKLGDDVLLYDDTIYGELPPWIHKSYIVTGSGSVTLEFGFRNPTNYYGLDDVRLSPVVPEPAVVQLPILIGLGMSGYWFRLRALARRT